MPSRSGRSARWKTLAALGSSVSLWMILPTGCTSTTGKGGDAVKAEFSPPPITIPAGTQLVVRTNSTLSTKSNAAGSTFTATLAAPLVDGERIIAPKGAEVEGRVAHSTPGGRIKGRASIALQLSRIYAAGNQVIPVRTDLVWRSAPGTRKRDALAIGVISGAGAAIGAIAGAGRGAAIGAVAGAGAGTGAVAATRGKPAVIAAESILTFRLRDAVTVER